MTIINFKKITTSGFDEDALTTAASDEHVFNFADLKTTGDTANGIFADANNVSIRNFAHIQTGGLGAAGIFVLGDDARIENYGSIMTTGGIFDPDPNVDGDESFSDAITVFGDRFCIANLGNIQVAGDSSSAMSGIGNDGTVANYGRIEDSAIFSAVLAVVGDRSHVINGGDVTASGDGAAAILVLGDDATALNLGRMQVVGDGSDGIGANGTAQVLTNKGTININAEASFGVSAIGNGDHINNFGLIETHGLFDLAIATRGLDFQILNAGRIATEGDGAIGIALGVNSAGFRLAANGTVDNRGVVETQGDGAAGVVLVGNNHHLINSGRIVTNGGAIDEVPLGLFRAAGVVVSGDGALLENTRSGNIESRNAGSAAVELNVVERNGLSDKGTSSRLENSGLIKGAGVAVLGGAGQDTVLNYGRIVGDVVLGDGSDTFVFGHGGSLVGNLYLGGGLDLVRVEDGAGTCHISDFQAGDVVDVSAFFSNFSSLRAHSTQQGSDVIIALDHNDRLVLGQTQLNTLSAGEFLFA